MLRQYILLENLVRTKKDQFLTRREERGATAVEYGLMVALIAVVIIVAVLALGNKLSGLFTSVNNKMTTT